MRKGLLPGAFLAMLLQFRYATFSFCNKCQHYFISFQKLICHAGISNNLKIWIVWRCDFIRNYYILNALFTVVYHSFEIWHLYIILVGKGLLRFFCKSFPKIKLSLPANALDFFSFSFWIKRFLWPVFNNAVTVSYCMKNQWHRDTEWCSHVRIIHLWYIAMASQEFLKGHLCVHFHALLGYSMINMIG